MARKEKQSFWTTAPGVVTAIAALITALVGWYVAVHPPKTTDTNGGVSPRSQSNRNTTSNPSTRNGSARDITVLSVQEEVEQAVRNFAQAVIESYRSDDTSLLKSTCDGYALAQCQDAVSSLREQKEYLVLTYVSVLVSRYQISQDGQFAKAEIDFSCTEQNFGRTSNRPKGRSRLFDQVVFCELHRTPSGWVVYSTQPILGQGYSDN